MLYRILLVWLIVEMTGLQSTAQQPFEKKPALGLHASVYDFPGADSLKAFGRSMKTGLALSYQNSLSARFDLVITLGGSFLNFPDRDEHSLSNGAEKLLLESTVNTRLTLLPATSRVFPFVQAGIGASQFNDHYGLFIPAGAGMQVNITPDVFVLLNTQYRVPLTQAQNNHFYHSIGLAGVIGKKKIVHAKPLPPPPPPIIRAPIDTDGDGIVDSVDKCPTVIGFIKYQGCPVPDRDGDKIADEDDACPDVYGLVQYKGCPPPDKDGDGIADADDRCPDVAGEAGNGGCPAGKENTLTRISTAAQHIYFATNKYNLLPTSYPALDEVAGILKAYPQLQLVIEGHTDNVGGSTKNQLLSKNRANAVKEYFLQAGINASRLQAAGYGQQQPVADNSTSEGRAKNRRVAFKVSKQ